MVTPTILTNLINNIKVNQNSNQNGFSNHNGNFNGNGFSGNVHSQGPPNSYSAFVTGDSQHGRTPCKNRFYDQHGNLLQSQIQ